MRKKGSKGSVFDLLLIMLVVFVLGILVVIGDTFLQTVYDATNETQAVNTTYIQKGQSALMVFDNIMPVIIAGLLATTIILAFMIPSHPVLVIPALFTLVIMIILSAQFANVYTTIIQTPELATSGNKMTSTALIMQNLPTLVLFMGIAIMIAMFVIFRRPDTAG